MHRPQVFRLHLIHQRIRERTYPNCRTLAERLEVDVRTVHRDIAFLRDVCRAPIAYDARRRGYYYESPDFTLPPVRLSEGEAFALLLGLNALGDLRGTGLEPALASLREKLPLVLPDEVSVDLDALRQGVSFFAAPLRGDAERVAACFAALRQAAADRRRVEMAYYVPERDEVTTRRVDPYHLRHFEGAWYLAGFCHLRGAVRTFALDRILDLRALDEGFDPPSPEQFSPEAYFGESWRLERGAAPRRVVVRFDPYQARWMRGRVWHPTQEAVEDADGSLTLSFTVSGLGEVRRWVMQFGARAEVLAPPELRAAVAAEAARLAGVYGAHEAAVVHDAAQGAGSHREHGAAAVVGGAPTAGVCEGAGAGGGV